MPATALRSTLLSSGVHAPTRVKRQQRLDITRVSQRYDMSISVRRNLAWMGFSQIGLFVFGFAGSVAIARLLTPREMGIYAVAAAVIGILNMIRSFGLNSLIIRETELTAPSIATIFTINAGLNVLCAIIILSVSEIGSQFLGDPGVRNVMSLLAINPLFNILEFLPSTRLERAGKFRVVAFVNLGKSLLNTGLTVLLAIAGFSYMSIAWGNAATSLFGATCFTALGWQFVSLRLGLHDWRRVVRFGLQMLAINAVAGFTGRLTDLLIGRLISLTALGLYSRAASLNSLLWDNLHLVIGRVVFVDFAEQHRRNLSFRESYLRIVAILTALLWPAFTGLAILARPIVATVYGEVWIDAALPLSMLSIAGVLYVAITMTHEIYTVTGEIARQTKLELKRNLVGSVLFALGCLGGLAWAAASRIGDALFTIFLAKNDLKRLTHTCAADYRPIYISSAGLTILACSPAALLMAANSWSEHTGLLPIFGAVLSGGCAWGVGLWYLKHPLYLEVTTVGRRVIGSVFGST